VIEFFAEGNRTFERKDTTWQPKIRKARRKSGGGKLTRSETRHCANGPEVRYLAELAARKQRRTLSSFIEWAVQQSFSKVPSTLVLATTAMRASSRFQTTERQLWDVDESERFVRLAIRYPDLLDHDEQSQMEVLPIPAA
jgi:hypothetical protein